MKPRTQGPTMQPFACRTVWISDIHLGSRGCRAEELSLFLKTIRCDRLYLVGDIVDFWRMKGRPFWPRVHNEVLRRFLAFPKHNTEVIFIPGNHDDAAREYVGFDFGGITVHRDYIHETVDGRRILVTHGDEYDLLVKHARLLSLLGGKAYETLIHVNQIVNRWRRRFGLPATSFSKTIKLKVKSACKYISDFEDALTESAGNHGLDGVICGHIHQPQYFRTHNVDYFNCGDWIESCSALIEREDGSMELIRFDSDAFEMRDPLNHPPIRPYETDSYRPRVHAARASTNTSIGDPDEEGILSA